MKLNGLLALLSLGFVVFFSSCTKLNEPTQLGEDLLPAVDNVNTFDTTLSVLAGYHPFNDSSKNLISDLMALGQVNDPAFGTTNANMYFNLSSTVYGSSPFVSRDSVLGIDSVVLALGFVGAYGDTSAASQLSVAVSEILPQDDFKDTILYRYDHPGFATGSVLGTKSFSIPNLKDTQTLIRKSDTTKVVNTLRIRLNESLGTKLSQYDAADNGAYKSDSLFRATFRGLAVKVTSANTPGTLAYFNLASSSSSLIVYYRKKNGGVDTTSATFVHSNYSQANSIMRTPGGEYLASLNATSPQKLYIQSSPMGSYAAISVPGLSTFPNKVIHRAELIAYRVPSAADNVLSVPSRLFLDHKGPTDTAFLFDNDIQISSSGTFDLSQFGGNLRSDNSYRFNVTRYIQGLVTRRERNDTLRLFAPLRTNVYTHSLGQMVSVPVLSVIANGRVVLAGDNYPDPALRLRLRIIYSNL